MSSHQAIRRLVANRNHLGVRSDGRASALRDDRRGDDSAALIAPSNVMRERLDALWRDVADANGNWLAVAIENVAAGELTIRDSDVAHDTAAMTRAQLLARGETVLRTDDTAGRNILTLLT